MFQYLPLSAKIYIFVLAFVLGAFLGSALHCLAWRMVRGEKWSRGRSRCPACGHVLSALDLVPVFSWLALRGKCRHCGGKIPARYVLSEGLLGLAFVLVLWRFGLTVHTPSVLILVCCLFCLSLVDLEIQIIPDRFLLIPALVRLGELLLDGGLVCALIPALIFGGGLLALSLVMDKILKKDTMGGGDIKLMALLGLYFTIPECLLLLVIACVLGIVMAYILMKIRDDTPFPFGPALSLAAFATALVGEPIVTWYLSLF